MSSRYAFSTAFCGADIFSASSTNCSPSPPGVTRPSSAFASAHCGSAATAFLKVARASSTRAFMPASRPAAIDFFAASLHEEGNSAGAAFASHRAMSTFMPAVYLQLPQRSTCASSLRYAEISRGPKARPSAPTRVPGASPERATTLGT
jgi:hypothetical protein